MLNTFITLKFAILWDKHPKYIHFYLKLKFYKYSNQKKKKGYWFNLSSHVNDLQKHNIITVRTLRVY